MIEEFFSYFFLYTAMINSKLRKKREFYVTQCGSTTAAHFPTTDIVRNSPNFRNQPLLARQSAGARNSPSSVAAAADKEPECEAKRWGGRKAFLNSEFSARSGYSAAIDMGSCIRSLCGTKTSMLGTSPRVAPRWRPWGGR